MASDQPRQSKNEWCSAVFPGWRDSGRSASANRHARPDIIAAAKPGQGLVATCDSFSENHSAAQPISGPKVNPSPNAAPIRAIPLARVANVVTSAM
jgi:hypothetical protein